MRRYLAPLLAFLLVPVVLFQTATQAAAESWGNASNFSVSQTMIEASGAPGPDLEGWTMTCNGTAAFLVADVESFTVNGRMLCDVDVKYWNDPEPGDLESEYFTLTFKGNVEGTSQACTLNVAPVTGDILTTQAYQTAESPTRCLPVEVCVTAYAVDPGQFARHGGYVIEGKCVPVDLGEIPGPPQDQCPYGNVRIANMQPVAGQQSYSGYYGRKVTISIELTPPGNPYWAAGTPYRGWGYDAREFTGSLPKTSTWKGGSTDVSNGSSWTMPNDWKTSDIGPGNLSAAPGEPKGIWIWIRKFDQAAGQSPGNGTYTDVQTPLPPLAKAHKDYAGVGPLNGWGVNDPANCHFYIGPKFWNDDSTDLDEPFGTPNIEVEPGTETEPPEELEPEPPVEPAGQCDFKWTDPTTWLTGGICELVKSISRLIDAVFGLPGRIWDAFKDGLEALFVPSDGFLDGKVEQLQDAFDDSTIGNYLALFEGMIPSGGSGCQGPGVTLNPFGSGGGTHYPLSSCGAVAPLADASRLIIGIGVSLSAGFACVRILGRSLGWNPGIGGDQ